MEHTKPLCPVKITPEILKLNDDDLYHVVHITEGSMFERGRSILMFWDQYTHIYLPLPESQEPDGWVLLGQAYYKQHISVERIKFLKENEARAIWFSPPLPEKEVTDEEIIEILSAYRLDELLSTDAISRLRSLFRSQPTVVKDGFEEWLSDQAKRCSLENNTKAYIAYNTALAEYRKLQPQGGNEVNEKELDKKVSVEILARYTRRGRGLDIAKKAFADCYNWLKEEGYIRLSSVGQDRQKGGTCECQQPQYENNSPHCKSCGGLILSNYL